MVLNEKQPPSLGAVYDCDIERARKINEFGNDQRRDQNARKRSPAERSSLSRDYDRIGVGLNVVA
jgi:hypothetical protein